MCLIRLAGGAIQRLGRNVFRVCNCDQFFLRERLLTVFTMDPEPEQNPFEAPAEVPQPMMMERSLSSESGSNSSVSTVYFAKGSKPGSAASSRSGSGASTSRSPPDQEVAARLLSWPSPSFNQGQIVKDDDHPSESTESKIIVEPSSEEKKDSEEKKNESALITKADSSTGFDYSKPSGHPIKELAKGADKIVTDVAHTETLLLKEAEQAADKYCCDCCCDCCRTWCSCRTCAPWGFCGDVAAVLCCPLTVFSLLSCICFRCPKLFANKTAEKVRSVKGRRKAEESEFEESTDAANVGSNPPTEKHVHRHHAEHTHHHDHGHEHCSGHHEEKPEATATVKSEKKEEEKGKVQDSPKMDAHRSYFFPSPEVEDDHPGSDKPAGR